MGIIPPGLRNHFRKSEIEATTKKAKAKYALLIKAASDKKSKKILKKQMQEEIAQKTQSLKQAIKDDKATNL